MPAKIASSAPRPPFELPRVMLAVRTSPLSCWKAGKTRIFTPVRESSGESRLKRASPMNERFGVGVAILSSAVGGGAAVATRYLIKSADPFTLAAIRFGGGVICLLPLALLLRSRCPPRRTGPRSRASASCSLRCSSSSTTWRWPTRRWHAAPCALDLAADDHGGRRVAAHRRLKPAQDLGILLAMLGVAGALVTGLRDAPPGAWRGDLIMTGATLCMALYNVWTRPFIQRSSALGFVTASMGVGAAALVVVSAFPGAALVTRFAPDQWLAAIYLAAGGGALAFFLWVYALQYASPSRVANTMTVNPFVAGFWRQSYCTSPSRCHSWWA